LRIVADPKEGVSRFSYLQLPRAVSRLRLWAG
jgi:hypothetical protein